MYSLNTIKGKLLIAFAFLTLIIIFLSGSSYWFSRKGQQIHLKKDLISLIQKNSIQLFKIDLIINNENSNEQINDISKASLIKKRNIIYSGVNENLNLLISQNEESKIEIDDNLFQLYDYLNEYHIKSSRFIFKETITEIELSNFDGTNPSFYNDSSNLQNIESLNNLYLLQEEIENECEIIKQKILRKQLNSQRDEKLIFIISVVYSIFLSIFLSLFTSSKISKPFQILSNTLERSYNLKLNKKIFRKVDQSSNEVKILINSFESLLKEISCQLEIIKEKSDILEKQNQHLQLSENHLNESNKVKDTFFSIIAHDLRGPFVTIKSFLEIIINHSEGFTKKEITNLAKEMSFTIEGISGLLENLLEWSRSQKGSIEYNPIKININEIIEKNVQLIKAHAANKYITVQFDVISQLNAFADYNMIDFILRNLLSNALKFTPQMGKVIIEGHENNDFIEIYIIDNGVGIDEEDKQKLFRKDMQFSKMGTSQEIGTGLGLLLCKEFIEKCSGNIEVESSPGIGTTFKFTLPNYTILNQKNPNL